MVPSGMVSLSQNGLRIKLNFDDDVQKSTGFNKVWFFVDFNLIKTIQDLQLQLNRRFKIYSNFQLFLQEFLLMPEESIAILRNEDLILIKRLLNDPNDENYFSPKNKKRKKCSVPNDDCGFSSRPDIFQNKPSPKNVMSHRLLDQSFLTEDVDCDFPRKHKSRKSKKNISGESEELEMVSPEGNAQSCDKFNGEVLLPNNESAISELGETFGHSSETFLKRKRSHRRRRKLKRDELLTVENDVTDHENKIARTISLVFPDGGESFSKKRQHIRFDEDGDNDDQSESRETWEMKSASKRQTNCRNVSRDETKSENITNECGSNHEDFEKKIYKRKTKTQMTDSIQSDINVEENEIQTASSASVSNIEPKQISTTKAKSFDSYDNLEGGPRIGDTIAFQELILAEDYSPVVSEYRVGKVKGFDSKTQLIEIELSDELTLIKPNGKFEVEQDEEDSQIKIKTMTINLKEMLNPKLII